MRLETVWQGRVSVLCNFTQLGLQEKNLLLAVPIQKLMTLLQNWFCWLPKLFGSLFFFFFFLKKSDFLAWSPRFWLGMSGVGPRNLHFLEESSDLNRNYSQTSGNSLIGHWSPAFKPWSHCRAQFEAALFELKAFSSFRWWMLSASLRNRIKWNHLYKGGTQIKQSIKCVIVHMSFWVSIWLQPSKWF